MNVAHPKALGISLAAGLALSFLVGLAWAVFGDKGVLDATGASAFVIGLIALAIGLLGALEPSQGWATGAGARRRHEGRRSLGAQISEQAPGLEPADSWGLALWGVVVGGGLIGLGMLALSAS